MEEGTLPDQDNFSHVTQLAISNMPVYMLSLKDQPACCICPPSQSSPQIMSSSEYLHLSSVIGDRATCHPKGVQQAATSHAQNFICKPASQSYRQLGSMNHALLTVRLLAACSPACELRLFPALVFSGETHLYWALYKTHPKTPEFNTRTV